MSETSSWKAAAHLAVEQLETRRLMSAGLAPDASEIAGNIATRPAGNTGTGFFVASGHIYDANGHAFTLKGFNHTTQYGDYNKNLDAINDFAKTGANAVRTVFGTFGPGGTPAGRASVVDSYLAQGIVPVVEDQSATNSQSPEALQAIVDRWLLPDNVRWLKQDERNVILNIANEWGPNSSAYRDVYISSIQRLRDAGVNAMILIDAGGSGQNPNTLEQYAKAIYDADPQHNVAFSVHMYALWRTEGATDVGKYGSGTFAGGPWDTLKELTKLQSLGIATVVGEYSMSDGGDVPYDTTRAIQIFDQLGLGSMAWSWNQNGNHKHDMLAATAGWQYNSDSDLSSFGDLVINGANGLKATAVPASSLRPATISGSVVNNDGSSVSGASVYIDDNNNGRLDSGELRVSTAADGSFTFTNLPQGLHHVRVSGQNAGPVAVALPAGDSASISLTTGGSTTGSVSGAVFNDTSHDGYQNGTEAGLAGRTVYLDLNNDGRRDGNEPTADTGSNGAFTFDNVSPGTYTVGLIAGNGYDQTTQDFSFRLGSGETLVNLTIGAMKPPALGQIAGVMFKDDNGNGVQDAGEGIEATRGLYIDLNNNGRQDSNEPTNLTGKDGTYLFTRLPPGTYTVAKTADGTVVTTGATFVSVSAYRTTTADPIGLSELPGSISGIVYNDANGNGSRDAGETLAAGIRVYADANGNRSYDVGELTQITDANGAFAFTDLPPKQYNVRAVAPDGQTLTNGTQFLNLGSAVDYPYMKLGIGVKADAGTPTTPVTTGTASISGVFFKDVDGDLVQDNVDVGFAGATVFLDTNGNGTLDSGEPSDTTDASGAFSFTNLPAGAYHLRAVQPSGNTIITPDSDVYVSAGQAFTGAKIAATPVRPNEPVATIDTGNAAFTGGTFRSTSNGGYTGSGYADFGGEGSTGTWSIWRSDTGTAKLTFRYANGDSQARPFTILINGVSAGTIACAPTGGWSNWGTVDLNVALNNGTNSITAVVGAAGGANIDSITVTTLQDRTAAGSISGYAFIDSDSSGSLSGAEAKSVGQTVFLDLDNDGVLDNGEAFTRTDANGAYTFDNLPAGNYSVRAVTPGGYTQTTPIARVSLAAGQDKNGFAIGLVPLPTGSVPPGDDGTTVVEAENGQFTGGTWKQDNHDGFTGDGFADFGGDNSTATWTVDGQTAGDATLTVRYALGSPNDRPMDIYVNGVFAGTLACTSTGGWSTWKDESLNVTLKAGKNTIKAVAGDAGGGNIDTLTLAGAA